MLEKFIMVSQRLKTRVLAPLSQVIVGFGQLDQISSYPICLAWLLVPFSVYICWYIPSVCAYLEVVGVFSSMNKPAYLILSMFRGPLSSIYAQHLGTAIRKIQGRHVTVPARQWKSECFHGPFLV